MKRAFILKAVFLTLLVSAHLCSKAQNLQQDTVKMDSTIKQLNTKIRNAFIELGGAGLALTANYDQRFNQGRDKWGFRAGAGYYNTGANWVFSVPLQVNYLYSLNKNADPTGFWGSSFLELGVGTTFVRSQGSTNGTTFEFDDITGFCGTATIGYRYQQDSGGFNFRIGFVPVVYYNGLIAEGGISAGWTF
jgi:hypothetical protein